MPYGNLDLTTPFCESLGKFNFGAIKDANMLAAVIFFVFSIVVNMVLINMMMAIINMSFEEVKVDKHKFKSKFQLFEYIKRSTRELYGSTYAKPIVVKYGKNDGSSSDDEASLMSIRHAIVLDETRYTGTYPINTGRVPNLIKVSFACTYY